MSFIQKFALALFVYPLTAVGILLAGASLHLQSTDAAFHLEPALAQEPACNVGAPSSNLHRVCVRLFAPGARPNVIALYTNNDLQWALDPANLGELRELAVGQVVFFGNLHTEGHIPGNGHYEYTEPELVARVQQAVRLIGCKVIGYIHGVAWKRAGLTPFDALEESKRHHWDGLYLDNGELGRTSTETLDFFIRAHNLGLTLIHHASVDPHGGYRLARGPWAAYEDYTRLGETGPYPKSLADPLWLYRVSQITRSSSIGVFSAKNAPEWKDQPELWRPIQPELGCIVWLSPWYIESWKEDYWPAYQQARAEWQADPAAFEARMMSKWR